MVDPEVAVDVVEPEVAVDVEEPEEGAESNARAVPGAEEPVALADLSEVLAAVVAQGVEVA